MVVRRLAKMVMWLEVPSLRIQNPHFGLCFGLVHLRHPPTIGITLRDFGLGCLDALGASPALAALGIYLAHLFDWVMSATVVTVSRLVHICNFP